MHRLPRRFDAVGNRAVGHCPAKLFHLVLELVEGMDLRELHHRPVRLARLQERFLPVRVAQVDADRLEARDAHAFERGREVLHLEGEVVRAGAVPDPRTPAQTLVTVVSATGGVASFPLTITN